MENSSTNVGGGLAGFAASNITLKFTTICGNTSAYSGSNRGCGFFVNDDSPISLTNSIVTYNYRSDNSGYFDIGHDASPTISGNYNILGDFTLSGTANTNYSYTDGLGSTLFETYLTIVADAIYKPQIGDNGGSTLTQAIADGSFAISAGSWDASITTDQRGESRRQYNPTIGAYEHLFSSISWTGNTDAIWGKTSNWSPTALPLSTDNITIPDLSKGTPPVIGPTSTADCNNLTINSGATLTIQSTVDGTGSLIVNGTASGNVTAERYVDVIAKGDKWHYVSSPVIGQNLNDTWMTNNDIAVSESAKQFFRYDEDENYWIIYGSTGDPEAFNDVTFVEARGYCLSTSGAQALSFIGTVRTDNVNYATTYTANNGEGCNLVGNPFTSSIGVTSSVTSSENFIAVNTGLLDDSYEAVYILG